MCQVCNMHPRSGRGHPSASPQPDCISQHLALDRSRRDTAELRSQGHEWAEPRSLIIRLSLITATLSVLSLSRFRSVISENLSIQLILCGSNVMSKYDRWIVIRGMSVVIRKLCLQCSVMFGLLELHYAELIVWEFWIRRSLPPSDLFE